ncbi:hypothetical protein ADK86_26175 [Streptomyces sp. NRRL F-5755]|uniref:hypothetical protein n=1 Tax=Streptomyces sp. NRRL F-5755 TaxID=1519475 RepID=UPI0006B0355A|nr:hypothetical protein [Streptomyces sp. NRRL F-5755]KOT90394.1 hypothetical protein ADK86_26175 [Streptomyces sp. NRRL F-5755]
MIKAIRKERRQGMQALRVETVRLHTVEHVFAGYVAGLNAQMRSSGITPQDLPPLAEECDRTET